MAHREVSRVEIAEVVRRWQSGNSQRRIATGMSMIRTYIPPVITTYIPPRQVGDGPWTPWYADYYHRAV